MNRVTKLIIILLLVIFLTPAYPLNIRASQVVDKIIAVVDGMIITQSDLDEGIIQFKREKKRDQPSHLLHGLVLQQMINNKIFESEIEKEKIAVPETEIEDAIRSVLLSKRMTKDQLARELSKEGLTLEEFQKNLEKDLRRNKFLQKNIYPRIRLSDYDLQQYYEKHPSEFPGFEKIRFLEILITEESVPTGSTLIDFIQKIMGQLRAGNSFPQLASRYSKGAFASQGGDSGLLDTREMRGDLKNILLMLPVRSLSEPLSVGGGVFIFKVLEKVGPIRRPFEEVKEIIQQKYLQTRVEEEVERYVLQMRSQHIIEIR